VVEGKFLVGPEAFVAEAELILDSYRVYEIYEQHFEAVNRLQHPSNPCLEGSCVSRPHRGNGLVVTPRSSEPVR
jgi:hypothetical protein